MSKIQGKLNKVHYLYHISLIGYVIVRLLNVEQDLNSMMPNRWLFPTDVFLSFYGGMIQLSVFIFGVGLLFGMFLFAKYMEVKFIPRVAQNLSKVQSK